jgi:hypothetical protein
MIKWNALEKGGIGLIEVLFQHSLEAQRDIT